MKIIISPAKTMKTDNDCFFHENLPALLLNAKEILAYLQSLSYDELKTLWSCSDKIATLNFERLQTMDLERNLSPAIFSYEGLQYQHLGVNILTEGQLEYLEKHLRILSGFYGILKPMDGITPYRLEMQAKAKIKGNSMYDFWGSEIYYQLTKDENLIINLASKEYSKVIEKFLPKDGSVQFVSCIFGEVQNGKVVEKGTFAKMARGEMVRFMAKNQVSNLDELKNFDYPQFAYNEEFSTETKLVFIAK